MKKILLFITLFSFAITQAQIVNIPDTNFKNALLNLTPIIDINADGEIQVSEAILITDFGFGLVNQSISDLTGIEEFVNLLELRCTNNPITNLDLSNNTNLTKLLCYSNQLTSLDLSNNTNLNTLDCRNNQITNLDLSNNTNLTELNCSYNLITTIDLSNNTNLVTVTISSNPISTLNLSNNLQEITILNTPITYLDLSNITNLIELSCNNNQLTSLDLSNNPNLTYFNCYDNQITNLDLSNNPNLTYFNCSHNLITTLDLSNNTNLGGFAIYNNSINSLDLSNNINLGSFNCSNNQIVNLDIGNNTNLGSFNCSNNQIVNLDIGNNTNLVSFNCSNNQIINLNLSNNSNLTDFICSENQITNLDLSNNPNLTNFNCSSNLITTLDLSNNTNLDSFVISNIPLTTLDLSFNTNLVEVTLNYMPNLEYLNLKSGSNIDFLEVNNNPNLNNICINDIDDLGFINQIVTSLNHPATFTEYCSLTPALSNQISGNIKFDLDNNGCDSSDLPISNLMLVTNNGTESFATFTQNNGDYLLYTNEGNFTTEVTTNLPNYFNVNPNSETNTFTGFNNTFTADFCIEPNQTINDVNISLIPIISARPGFNTTYHIVYENVGTTQLNGNVTLEFDETKLSFLNASETVNTQTSNSLTFNYTNLNPFETRIIDLEFNVFAPPTVEIDDILNFTATINPIAGDYTTDDNIFTLNQTLIGSYDPNDITCLEGNEILLAETDKYLHYVIRFQNTGTASAINVVVTNDLDANLDWSTLQLESLSHNNRIAIKNGNEIEFIFENINLPDNTTDEPNSHGFIAYKIKPKTDIALDDIILNKANIFFDYNSPIETNTAITTIVNALAVNENTLLDFSVFPTPTENILNIKSKTEITKIKIYSKLGQLIKETTENKVDVSNLTQGLYFVKVEDENGNFGIKKFIKR